MLLRALSHMLPNYYNLARMLSATLSVKDRAVPERTMEMLWRS